MQNSIWEKKVSEYKKKLQTFGATPKALKWSDKDSMMLRHKELILDLDIEGKSILDVGCGFGDIISLLRKKSPKFFYTGIDIVPDFIRIAKKRYPGFSFVLRNYFENPLKRSFDIVLASGTLNSDFKYPVEFRKKAIKIMFSRAKEVLAFNMAGSNSNPKNKSRGGIFYADPQEVFEYCLSLTKKVIFRQHYHPKDFTIVMFKVK